MLMNPIIWKHAQVSVRGASHLRNDLPCQDANGFLEVSGALVCALADGAGSACRADLGSKLAVDAALDYFLGFFLRSGASGADARLDSRCGMEMLEYVRRRIAIEAYEQAASFTDYASTLLVAVVTPQRVALYQVGDGLWCVSRNGVMAAMTWPTGGEHASETTFVTCESASKVLQFETLEGEFDALFGMTDGVERLALNVCGRVPHPGFFAPLARELQKTGASIFSNQLAQLLASEAVCRRTDDDKTLAIILHEPNL
jgi:hypothetical protein